MNKGGEIKRLLLKSTSKKRVFIALFLFISLGLFFPKITTAIWPFDSIANSIAAGGLHILFEIFKALAVEPLKFASSILDWVMSEDFMGVSYTGQDNPIVQIGWTTMRNFANMFFIIALVVIGIATALRYKEYQFQKTLPKLIAIALLINFTPAIAGVIIDASDIAMNYFLGGVGGTGAITRAGNLQNPQTGAKTDLIGWLSGTMENLKENAKVEDAGGNIGKGIFLVAFSWIATIIFLLYAVLFAVRYVALWILIILSPLAFLCYIFPFTRKFWSQWWSQFIQWCIVGIPAALTLFLVSEMLTKGQLVSTPTLGGFAGFVNFMVTFSIPIILLIIGFLISLKTSAYGASTTINVARKGGRAIGFGAAGAAGGATAWSVRKMRERVLGKEEVEEKGKELARTRAPTRKEWKKMGRWEKAKTTMGRVAMPYAVRRAIGRRMIATREARRKEIKEAEESIKEDESISSIISKFRSTKNWRKKIGDINALIKRQDLSEAMDTSKYGKSALTRRELLQTLKEAEKYNAQKTIQQAVPHIAKLRLVPPKTLEKDIIGKMKPSDYKNVSRDALKNTEVMDAMLKRAMGNHISNLIETHGQAAAEAIEKRLRALGAKAGVKPGEWLKDKNPRLHRYITKGGGRGLIDIE